MFELTLDRGQRDLLSLEIILGGENIEITLRDALDQVLLRGLIVRFGLCHLGVRALQSHPIFPTKQILLQVEAVAVGSRRDFPKSIVFKNARADRGGGIDRSGISLVGHEAASRELRQQGRKRLGFGLEGGQPSRFGFAQLWIVLQRTLIDRQKIRGRRRTQAEAQCK